MIELMEFVLNFNYTLNKHTYELIPIQTENEYSNLCFMEANIIWVCCTRSCVQKLMAHETSFISY